jgi:hypothetical protein
MLNKNMLTSITILLASFMLMLYSISMFSISIKNAKYTQGNVGGMLYKCSGKEIKYRTPWHKLLDDKIVDVPVHLMWKLDPDSPSWDKRVEHVRYNLSKGQMCYLYWQGSKPYTPWRKIPNNSREKVIYKWLANRR